MPELEKQSRCPYCSVTLRGAFDVDDDMGSPVPGDLTICIECANLLIFSDDMRVRKLKPKEKASIDGRTAAVIVKRKAAAKLSKQLLRERRAQAKGNT